MSAKTNAERALETKERLVAMTPDQRRDALFRMLRFMCSDDEGNWDQAKADRLQRVCEDAELELRKGLKL